MSSVVFYYWLIAHMLKLMYLLVIYLMGKQHREMLVKVTVLKW